MKLAKLNYLLGALTLAIGLPAQGLAQDYPTKPIRLFVPFAPDRRSG